MLFFKQKTAYELRISECSSDVCASDLLDGGQRRVLKIRNDMQFELAFRLRPGIAPFGLEIAVSEDVDIRGEAERGSLTGASMFVLHRIDALADKLREAISLITCGCGRPGAAQFPDGPPPCFRSASTETILEDERLCS